MSEVSCGRYYIKKRSLVKVIKILTKKEKNRVANDMKIYQKMNKQRLVSWEKKTNVLYYKNAFKKSFNFFFNRREN